MLAGTHAHLRRWGVVRTAWLAVVELLKRLGVFVCWVNVRPLDSPAGHRAVEDSADVCGLVIKRMTLADCLSAADDPELQMTPDFVVSAFDLGWMCHAAYVDSRVVAYAWRATDQAPNNAVTRIKIPQGYSYGFKAYTRPAFRGKGIYPLLAQAEVKSCRAAGFTEGVSFTEVANFASLAADRKFGNRRIGLAGYVQWRGQARGFATRAVRELGFEFVPIEPA